MTLESDSRFKRTIYTYSRVSQSRNPGYLELTGMMHRSQGKWSYRHTIVFCQETGSFGCLSNRLVDGLNDQRFQLVAHERPRSSLFAVPRHALPLASHSSYPHQHALIQLLNLLSQNCDHSSMSNKLHIVTYKRGINDTTQTITPSVSLYMMF